MLRRMHARQQRKKESLMQRNSLSGELLFSGSLCFMKITIYISEKKYKKTYNIRAGDKKLYGNIFLYSGEIYHSNSHYVLRGGGGSRYYNGAVLFRSVFLYCCLDN